MEGWKYGVLEDVVLKGSSNLSLSKIRDDDGDYPVFGAKGFVQNVSFFQQEQEYLAIIKDGAGIGRVSKHPSKSSVLATMQYLIPKKGFDIDFIRYFLTGVNFEKYRTGSTIPHIYFKDYKAERFPILPLPEQERIVAMLDEAFAAIDTATANTEKNLANAKELFESQLEQALGENGVMEGWEERTLAEVCAITSKLVDPKEASYIDLPHIGAGNMVSESGKIVDVQTAREEGLISGKFLFDETAVLYSKIRPYLKKIHRPSFQGLCSADVYPLVCLEGNSVDFLYYLLMSDHFTKYAIAGSARAGMPKVNRTHLFAYQRLLPPLSVQERIVAMLDEASEARESLQSQYQHKNDSLSQLKQSLLQKAFTGELTADPKVVDRTLSEASV